VSKTGGNGFDMRSCTGCISLDNRELAVHARIGIAAMDSRGNRPLKAAFINAARACDNAFNSTLIGLLLGACGKIGKPISQVSPYRFILLVV